MANKAIEHTYEYDANGNVTREYRSGAGGQEKYDYTHSYDALDRLTRTDGLWGYATHTYEYDSLGNLVYEKNGNGAKQGNEYWYNKLNQQVKKQVDGKDDYSYTYDKRGNLIKGVYDKKNTVTEQYTYDATNRMVKGTNEAGEESHYIYNGLGYLVANEWVIEKNAYGYTNNDVAASPQVNGVVVCDRHKNTTGQGHINPKGKGHTTGGTEGGVTPNIDNKKFIVVHKDYVLDYTSALHNGLMETESGAGGLTYRYTYGLDKANIVISGISGGAGSIKQGDIVKLYYHHDRLGSTDYLTNNIDGKVESYVEYDDWGAQVKKPILKMGVRELDLVTEYTGYAYDQVSGQYYAKARMYDAADRRFTAVDPVKGYVPDAQTMVQYTYCLDNPIRFVDPLGMALDRGSESTNTDVGLRDFSEAAGADVGWNEETRKATVTKDGVTKEYDINDYKVIDGRIQINPKDLDWLLPKEDKEVFDKTVDRINRMSDKDILDYAASDYGKQAGLALPPIESLSAAQKAVLANQIRQQMILSTARDMVTRANNPWFLLKDDVEKLPDSSYTWDSKTSTATINIGGITTSFIVGTTGVRITADGQIEVRSDVFAANFMPSNGERVFLGSYDIPLSPWIKWAQDSHHSDVIMMVDDRSEHWGTYPFETSRSLFGGGIQFATISANSCNCCGVNDNTLVASYNDGRDVGIITGNLTWANGTTIEGRKLEHLTSEPGTVSTLIERTDHFIANHNEGEKGAAPFEYFSAPRKSSDHFNSNSFTHGLLIAAGIAHTDKSSSPFGGYPGWDGGQYLVDHIRGGSSGVFGNLNR